MQTRISRWAFALALALVATTGGLWARDLTFEDRVKAQEAIERVYWSHRIWPGDNARAKPPFEQAVPADAIRAKVLDDIRKSNALEQLWKRPLTQEQLQAEMERLASHSRAPAVLREIFEALGNDPELIAETLARQTLADRLIRRWYARDERFHRKVRREVEAALVRVANAGQLRGLGAAYTETTWKLIGEGAPAPEGRDCAGGLSEVQWRDLLQRLERMFPPTENTQGAQDGTDANSELARLTVGTVTSLNEEDDAFEVGGILRKEPGTITIATVSWPKAGFDDWWAARMESFSGTLASVAGRFARVTVTATTSCDVDTWTRTVGPPDPRSNQTAVWTGAEMIVWGGSRSGYIMMYYNTGGRYNPSTDSWTSTSSIGAPFARSGHTAIWTGSEMLVWGGKNSTVSNTNTGGKYNPTTNTWTATSTTGVATSRYGHTAVWTGSEMIVWGGCDINYCGAKTGARYNPSTDVWTAIATAPVGRYNHVSVWTGSEMIVWGGSATSSYTNTGARYNLSADSWTTTSTTGAPDARSLMTALWSGQRMIIWGGRTATISSLNTGGRYDPSSDGWQVTTLTGAPSARSGHTAVWTGTEMIVWGGTSVNDGGRYNPSTDSWMTTSTTGEPAARGGHSAVWTGSEMIVWGGNYLDTGGRYNLALDSWVPTSGSGAPSPRTVNTTVWTGSEMIVWGGALSGNPVNTGGRYVPATDSWTSTATLEAPVARSGHCAVWTGGEMIVWGGANNGSPMYNDGGRYAPATNTWTAMASAGAPTARMGPTAVWTGNEMLIWGGSDINTMCNSGASYAPSQNTWKPITPPATGRLAGGSAVWSGSEMVLWGATDGTNSNLGGRYNPTTATWRTTTASGAPASRYGYSTVWTGSEMIVWGGSVTSYPSNTGGRYNPFTDTWTSTPINAAVVGREFAPAVWTGREMVVWGGHAVSHSIGYVLGDGWQYDPATGVWTAISMIGAPMSRWNHSAAWTGTEMIVWAGNDGGTVTFNDGNQYCASSCSSPSIWYQDHDGDGFGTGSVQQVSCTQPAGFAAASGDCNDLDSAIRPGAAEICNGIDDDCDGTIDNGIPAPSGHPLLTETRSDTDAVLSWTAVSGATGYDIVKGSLAGLLDSGGDFTTSTTSCLGRGMTTTTIVDIPVPAAGNGWWHLVRAANWCSGSGSYDEGAPSQIGSRDAEIEASESGCP